jgi:hypothetical protein
MREATGREERRRFMADEADGRSQGKRLRWAPRQTPKKSSKMSFPDFLDRS